MVLGMVVVVGGSTQGCCSSQAGWLQARKGHAERTHRDKRLLGGGQSVEAQGLERGTKIANSN